MASPGEPTSCAIAWGSVADWLVAGGTFLVAVVAAFQDRIRVWLFRPHLSASIQTGPPDCDLIPLRNALGGHLGDAAYLRMWINNSGNSSAEQAEVYARQLERLRQDGNWERVETFPPMNLVWSHLRKAYFPRIAPNMGKHCDLGHVIDPARRAENPRELNPALGLPPNRTSLAFDLVSLPNSMGHVVGPGQYRLTIVLAAANAKPKEQVVQINLVGPWYPNQADMLRDGVGVTIE